MSFTHLTCIFQLLLCVTAKKSFTLVIDTSLNMQNEIHVIKSNIEWVVDFIQSSSLVEHYLSIPIDDFGVGSVQSFTSPEEFVQSIRILRPTGSRDLLINSFSGLVKALEESRPDSNIFLFTNKCAKDGALFRNVQYMCRRTRSKVVIFASGNCGITGTGTGQFGGMGLYHDACKVCSGNFFWLEPANLRQAFNFIREIVKDGYDKVIPFESFTGNRQLIFTADSFTRDAIVAVTGYSPVLHLQEESGQSPHTEKLIDTRRALVVRIPEPQKGQLTVNVVCQGVTSVTIYKREEFPFQIGFSRKYPRSIRETATTPLPGEINYILIQLPKRIQMQLKTLEVQIIDADDRKYLNLVDTGLNSDIYTTQAFFEAQKSFRLKVTGREENANEDFAMSSKILDPQIADFNAPWAAPLVEIINPDSPLTDYEQNATAACKVTGSPKPTIWWEDESGQQITAEVDILEYPSTYISYVSIPSLKENRTVYCKATNPNGNYSSSIRLFVYRPYVFEMINTPKDSTFEYGTEGKLYCQVKAYPKADIKWYHNATALENTNVINDTIDFKSELDYDIDDQALVIRNMTTRFSGNYKCEAHYEGRVETFTATVNISGLEPPEIEVETTEVISNLGDEVKLSCRVSKGRPKPVLTWQYKTFDDFDFTDIPSGVDVEEENIIIDRAKSEHKGIYKCAATNDQGNAYREVTLNVHYAPIIKDNETTTRNVIEDSGLVELKCLVDADPKATVRWERSQDDKIVPFGDTHSVDDENTYKFYASINDSGTYRCIAENEAGKAEKVTIVNVLVPPVISSMSKTMSTRAGSAVSLPCVVMPYANPAPSIIWSFTALDSVSTTLFSEDGTYSKTLRLENVSKANAGTYRCVVENSVGFDSIRITLKVI